MRRRDVADLLLLAMLWGGSFLFMRLAAPEFGAVAMAETRVAVAAIMLYAIVWRHGLTRELWANWRGLGLVGATNSALPFTLFGYAMLSITAGFGAILNATSPLFGAVLAYFWLRERLPWLRIAGLMIGFAGVALLVWGKPAFSVGGDGWAIAAILVAAVSYTIGPLYTKRNLARVPSLVVATGSQVSAALLLLPFAVAFWPPENPSAGAWAAAIVLGIASTGLAYILYFRLIKNIGPTRAIAVTFLVPAFGMLWGMLFLGETVTANMIAGCAVILAGTALATGVIGARGAAE
ncbi:MAG: DMT family transporter [Betaproteobacteria bacterium]|nr:DMT family transporter [Betaproteobacteria bacterium]